MEAQVLSGWEEWGGFRKDTEQKEDSVLRLKVHNIREEKLIEGKLVRMGTYKSNVTK